MGRHPTELILQDTAGRREEALHLPAEYRRFDTYYVDVRPARDYGYAQREHWDVIAPPAYELVEVGDRIKPGDFCYVKYSETWEEITPDDKGKRIESHFRPVIRRQMWECKHGRDEGARYCCVCNAFGRFVTKKW